MEANRFDDFIVNLSGRPPQRVRAYNSRNNHDLNNTLMDPHQVIYLVEFYEY